MSEDPESPGRLRKAPTAFRTISEVAEDLQIPQHVLRFWETKFPQLKPLKRGGGRRYYRPEDIALLRRIGDLLYTQGYTIKGVQRLLRDGGEAESQAEPMPDSDEAETILPEAGQSALRRALSELEALADELRALAQPPAHSQE
ncbi:MerR family transcriptional regulator [Pseudoroseomonas cervicalis]|uniref:MerR family transcriptional regulator n=1 Tax=Teichococcus cervicalis TaxID=204525 RepID=UPI0038D0EF57